MHGHSESALHLIQIGAEIKQTKAYVTDTLPTELYISNYSRDYNAELFTLLIPVYGRELLHIVNLLLGRNNQLTNSEVMSKMFQQLLQRLIFDWPISLTIEIRNEDDFSVDIQINQNDIYQSRWYSLKETYLWSLLLSHLDCNMTSTQEATGARMHNPMANEKCLAHVQAIDDLWKKCRSRSSVHSLLRLIIQQVRQSMNNLSDSSFLTLPVPSSICKMLMYQDITDVVCEAWLLWPHCLPVDNYT